MWTDARGRGSEVIPGSLVVSGSILESAMLAWLGSDVMGPSTVDMSTHTLTGYSWGAILAQVVFLDTRLPTSVSACYFNGKFNGWSYRAILWMSWY